MASRRRNIILLLIAAALLAAAVFFIVPLSEKTRLGLDLQGGLSVMLEAQDNARAPRTDEGMNQAVNIINDRVNRLGVTEPEIQRQGEWKISIQLPGIDNPDEALSVIGKTAVLEFFDVKQFGTSFSSETDALQAAGVDSADKLPAEKQLIHWPADRSLTGQDAWFIVDTEPKLTGSDLTDASVGYDQNNQPKVDLKFNSEGAAKFAEVTTAMSQTAQITGTDQLLAITLDGRVESAPRVQEPIEGGSAEITGRFGISEAKQLALVLKTGALPIELQVISQQVVGATLGQESLRQALLAGTIGMLLVSVFLIIRYRLLGVLTIFTLVTYGVIFLGLLNAIGATLTLPGVAGFILTVGMAVDANVIIFARVKEEVVRGKTLRTAVDTGFRKSLSAILDANITALLTAIVLFFTATGGVRGFALTLAIGVVLSVVNVILVSRSLLVLLAPLSVFSKNLSLLGLKSPARPFRGGKAIPFMKYKFLSLGVLGAVTAFAVIAILVVGLSLGIEFEGGARAGVQLAQPATVEQVREAFSSAGVKEPIVQYTGNNAFTVTAQTMNDDQFRAGLDNLASVGATGAASGLEQVGPSFGEETANRALLAVGISIVLTLAYIAWRFDTKFALPTIASLVHIVGLTLGIYAITGRLVTTATVAAILTILGYSINDTIIVFDRVRENQHYMTTESYSSMVDASITQVLGRSITTSITELLPLLAILLFGGETLKDFAFALFIGIACGAYSSIFVACPLLVLWKEREPRYRKRLVAAKSSSGE